MQNVVVEDVFSDILPALVLSRDVVNTPLPKLITTAFLVPHCHCYQYSCNTHMHTHNYCWLKSV